MGWAKQEWDAVDDNWWQSIEANDFVKYIEEKYNRHPERFRFSIKGEIWNHPTDVIKVMRIGQLMPTTKFWIPTRAWRDEEMRECIERYMRWSSNVRVLASVDPSNTEAEIEMLREQSWSIVATGGVWNDRNQMMLTPNGVALSPVSGMHRCEKTWDQNTGHCLQCEDGCFKDGRVEIHLKRHQ